MSDRPYEVSHRTKGSHWCGERECWSWVVDCVHCVDPLRIPHRLTPKDIHVRSFAYDPAKRRLEIFYKWKTGSQYYPISLAMFRQIERAEEIRKPLDEWIKQRRIRWDEVRTERKLVAEMLCGVRLILEQFGGNME
jgi:hypothetical protein